MPRRVSITTLNATTVDILNTIRANASAEYQSLVPEISDANEVTRVGQVIYGYPALANQFVSALVNRIAMVRINSATFNNAYAELKKGYLEFGEVVEEVFVNICKAREFSAEKAAAREFKRSLPDVRAAFHCINYRAQYPITIQDEDLRMAFTNVNGVQDLIAKIVNMVYVAAEYDEFLLFKYLIIKAIVNGQMKPVTIDSSVANNLAKGFRGVSNKMEFMSNIYNIAGVTTNTKRADQYIFMDADLNAEYDVDILAGAFNMDKATFVGKLKLIDDWSSFDNDRFEEIRNNSDGLEVVTDAELALMSKVKAILVDSEWFQVYDNLNKMTETYVASGMYWNYFYNVWKTVSSSPFSNAVVFVDSSATTGLPDEIKFLVTGVQVRDYETGGAYVFTLEPENEATLADMRFNFVQTEDATEAGVAIHKYGAVIVPYNTPATLTSVALELTIGGTTYYGDTELDGDTVVGDEITFTVTPPDED